MPKFEVLFTDTSEDPPDRWQPLGEIRTTRNVDAIRELGGKPGHYRVREVAGDPRVWRMSADGTLQSINQP